MLPLILFYLLFIHPSRNDENERKKGERMKTYKRSTNNKATSWGGLILSCTAKILCKTVQGVSIS